MDTGLYRPPGWACVVSARSGWETIITLRGELDLATVGNFEAACEAIDFASVRRAVLDLQGLVFIDARGLRSVLRLHESCLSHSVSLLIRPGPRAVQRVFELTNADRRLSFE